MTESSRGKKKQPNEHIQVFVRCRPLTKSELNLPAPIEVYPEVNKIIVRDNGTDKSTAKTYSFDKVFGPEAQQADIYNKVVAPVIEEVILGFNCTIFAYGQTGTGKTFTIEGGKSSNLKDRSEDPLAGIIPRSMKHLFNELTSQNTEFNLCVSFLELYNEEIFDLLSNSDYISKLKIFDNSAQKGSVIVQGLQIVPVTSMEEVYDILDKGCKKRRKGATLLNKASSRSHTIFTVTVSTKESSTTLEKLKSGKLNLVDLAGSENIGRSGAIDKRAREAGNINQSLLALGRVITSLSEQAGHIPYRESKLTRLLQDSLGGQTKTAVIATISPSVDHIDETLNTLEYALRAKSITNKPELNSKFTVTSLTQEYFEEINRLRNEISKLQKEKGYHFPEEHIKHWESTLVAKRDEKFKILSEIMHLTEEAASLDKACIDASLALNEKKNLLENMTVEVEENTKKLEKVETDKQMNEAMIQVMQPMIDCLHEKIHRDLEEQNMYESETNKIKEKLKCKLKEQKNANATLKMLLERRTHWNDELHRYSENLINNIRDTHENVNLMTSKCNNYIKILKGEFEARVDDCEKEFGNLFKSINHLTRNVFNENVESAVLEEKSAKLKWVEEFQQAYLSMNETSILQPFDKAAEDCETSLLGISAALKEWKNNLSSEMNNQNKVLKEYLSNQNKTLESTIDCANALLSKQNDDLEACKNIISESIISSNKKAWNEKFVNIEQALSMLDMHCTDYIQTEVDKSAQVQTIFKNCSENRNEIISKITHYCDRSVDEAETMVKNVNSHTQNMFTEKWGDLKKKVGTSCTKYKDLNSELTKYSSTSENHEEFSRDIEDSLKTKFKVNQQTKVPLYIQEVSNTILKCGENIKSFLTGNQNHVDESLSKNKLHLEKLTESSKQLSSNLSSALSRWIQSLENDLLKNLTVDADREMDNTLLEETIHDNTVFDLEETITSTDCLENSVSQNPCPICSKRDIEETLQADAAKVPTSLLSPTLQVKSFMKQLHSSYEATGARSFNFPVSPIKRPRGKNPLIARKNLQFYDVEKLTHELLETSDEGE